MVRLNSKILRKMIRAVINTREDEIGCDDCFDKMHKFAEMELKGKSPEEAMPLVQDHLNRCGECRDEYEALLAALKQMKVYG